MLDEIRVGPITSADGGINPTRGGKTGEVIATDAHGRYHEAVSRGNCFFAANQAAATFAVGLTTTTVTSFAVTNPVGSGKNLSLLQVEFINNSVIVAVVGLSVMPISATAVTQNTALVVRNAFIGNGSIGAGLAASGVTFPNAAVVAKALFATVSTSTTVTPPPSVYDLGGSILLAPGTACAVLSNTASTGFISMLWEELPIV